MQNQSRGVLCCCQSVTAGCNGGGGSDARLQRPATAQRQYRAATGGRSSRQRLACPVEQRETEADQRAGGGSIGVDFSLSLAAAGDDRRRL